MIPTRISASALAIACLSVALAGTIAVEQHQKAELRETVSALATQVSNDLAKTDATRMISAGNAKLAKALGDSLHLYQRLIVQAPQQADAIDKALQLERIGRYAMETRLDSLQRVIASRGPVTEDTTPEHVRRASFDVRQAPYTVAAAVELPSPPDTAHIDLRIALDPIPVVAHLSCAAPNASGIRAASIEASAPAWVAITFTNVQQSADLCASPALTKVVGRSFLKFKPVVVGVGRIVLPDGTSRWGGFLGAGFAVASR